MQKILFYQLLIPTWQIVLCACLTAFLMLSKRFHLIAISIYLFVLFWMFHLYRNDLLSLVTGDSIAVALYSVFGLALGTLTLYAFFSPGNDEQGTPFFGPEMANLRRALLKRIDNMESEIKEAESKAMTEVRQSEELQLDAESKATLLQTQLEEKAEVLRKKEAALKELEDSLNDKIVDLEDQVKQKDVLLEQQGDDIGAESTELEDKATELGAQLLDTEDSLREREENAKKLEETLNARIHEMENQLSHKEILLEKGDNTDELEEVLNARIHDLEAQLNQKESLQEKYDGETNSIRVEMEQKASTLEAELRDKAEALQSWEANARHSEENLSSQINGLELQLREKEDLLEKLKREGFDQQQMVGELEGLKAELENRNSILQAREMEVRMIKRSMPDKVRELEKNPTEKGPHKFHLRSFLAAIEKGK